MGKFRSVSESELVLVRIIWDNGGVALYADIINDLNKQNVEWSRNMIIILLRRLVDKKLLKTRKIGRRNEYTALLSRDEYNAVEAKQLVDRLFDGNAISLMKTLRQFISEEECGDLA